MSLAPAPAQVEALYARLLDRDFGLAEIARLTDRQIADLVGHRRDEKGEVEDRVELAADEAGPPRSERELAWEAIHVAGATAGIPAEDRARLWAEWEAKHGEG